MIYCRVCRFWREPKGIALGRCERIELDNAPRARICVEVADDQGLDAMLETRFDFACILGETRA